MFIILNGLAILLAVFGGRLIKDKLDASIQSFSMPIFAAITLCIGIRLVMKEGDTSVVVLSVLSGFLVGESLHMEDRLEQLAVKTTKRFVGRKVSLTEEEIQYFISGFILMVCSTAGVLGAMTLAMTGDYSILLTKAFLDFMLVLVYSFTVGPGIGILAIPVWLVLGIIFAATSFFNGSLSGQMILNFSMCGGIIQLVNAMKMLLGKRVHVASLIPAIPMVFLLTWLFDMFPF